MNVLEVTIYLTISSSTYLSIHPSFYPAIYPPIHYLSTHPSIHLSIHLLTQLATYPSSIYHHPSTCLSIETGSHRSQLDLPPPQCRDCRCVPPHPVNVVLRMEPGGGGGFMYAQVAHYLLSCIPGPLHWLLDSYPLQMG